MATLTIYFDDCSATAPAAAGDTLLDAALDAGVTIEHECGGNCACTTCMVLVLSGAEHLSPMEAPEQDRIATAHSIDARDRLACQAILRYDHAEVAVRPVG